MPWRCGSSTDGGSREQGGIYPIPAASPCVTHPVGAQGPHGQGLGHPDPLVSHRAHLPCPAGNWGILSTGLLHAACWRQRIHGRSAIPARLPCLAPAVLQGIPSLGCVLLSSPNFLLAVTSSRSPSPEPQGDVGVGFKELRSQQRNENLRRLWDLELS